MAVKQFPADMPDITATASKILGAKADGTPGNVDAPNLQNVTARGGTTTLPVSFTGGIGVNRPPSSIYKFVAQVSTDLNIGLYTQNGAVSIEAFNDAITASKDLALFGTTVSVPGANFGVRKSNPAQALDVVGNIVATGSITPGSDKRLKKLIKNLPPALSSILELRPVSYTLREDDASALGFIADEVVAIFPELVIEGKDDKKMLAMNYMGLTAPIVKAIQEQQKIIQALTERIKALEAK